MIPIPFIPLVKILSKCEDPAVLEKAISIGKTGQQIAKLLENGTNATGPSSNLIRIVPNAVHSAKVFHLEELDGMLDKTLPPDKVAELYFTNVEERLLTLKKVVVANQVNLGNKTLLKHLKNALNYIIVGCAYNQCAEAYFKAIQKKQKLPFDVDEDSRPDDDGPLVG